MSNAPAAGKKKKNKSPSRKAQKESKREFVDQFKPQNTFRLSPCGEKYLDSLLDPFEGPSDACIPNWPSFPSGKIRVFSRGALNIGTAGMGYIVCRGSAASDSACLHYSTPTYAGTTIANSGTGDAAANPNSGYVAADFVANVSQRLVSMGIRVRYTGTELNRGGAIYTLEHPEHSTLVGLDVPAARAFNSCHGFPVDKDWTQICYMPIQASEVVYWNGAQTPSPPGNASNNAWFMAILIQSTAGNSFEFEWFANYEVIGSTVRDKTPSDTDIVGLGVVTGSLRSHNDGAVDRRVITLKGDRRPQKASGLPGVVKAIGGYAWKQLSGFMSDPGKIAKMAGIVAPMIMA